MVDLKGVTTAFILLFSWTPLLKSLAPLDFGLMILLIILAGLIVSLNLQLSCPSLVAAAIGMFFIVCKYEEPYADQYLHFQASKVIDVLSLLKERSLYSTYRTFPENQVLIQGLGGAINYWEYNYLPLSLLPSLLHLPFGIDPRVVYTLTYLLSIVGNALFVDQKQRNLVYALCLCSSAPYDLGVFSLSNSALTPLCFLLLRFGLHISHLPIRSGILIAGANLFNQTMWLSLPFVLIYCLRLRRLKTVSCVLIVMLGVLGSFCLPDVSGFYRNVVIANIKIDDEVFLETKLFSSMSLSGVIAFIGDFSPEYIHAVLPRKTLATLGMLLALILFFRLKRPSVQQAILFGIMAIVGTTFTLKYAWIGGRYFLGPLLMICTLVDPNSANLMNAQLCNRLWRAIQISFFATLAVGVFGSYCLSNTLNWAVDEVHRFDLPGDLPASRFSLIRGYGVLPTSIATYFWIVVPPGKFHLESYSGGDAIWEEEITINPERTFSLRIPFRIDQTVPKSFAALPLGDMGFQYAEAERNHFGKVLSVRKISD